MSDKYRDPIHGFIRVSKSENKIINSLPFQRLRNIRQLAMTYLVFYGAEHTRFGHSLGVMFLVTKAFESAVDNAKASGSYIFDAEKCAWYKQILRLIALTHDLGHAPFSHASEAVFPEGMEHEDFTEKIVKETEIADYISEIGQGFKEKYGSEYDITPDLICDIYSGKNPGENYEFTFLKSFMDSELDCDKMDYLLRDSLFCGVNYGRYDIERLLTCLTIHKQDESPRLAITDGGIQALEEFVLARYFMFIEVYFHRTRRYFDLMLARALSEVLPDGKYPDSTSEYLKWNDNKVLELLAEKRDIIEAAGNIIKRRVYPCIYSTKTHTAKADRQNFRMLKRSIFEKFDAEEFLVDTSAAKMPHKIPVKTDLDDEKAIIIVHRDTGMCSTISEESNIIQSLASKIDIYRLYVSPERHAEVRPVVQEIMRNCSEED